MKIEDILTALIQSLASIGLIDTRHLKEKLEMIDEYVFYCSDRRLNYDKMASEIVKHPILLECTRQRAYNAARTLEKRIGESVYKLLIGKKIHNVYILYTSRHEDQIKRIYMVGARNDIY